MVPTYWDGHLNILTFLLECLDVGGQEVLSIIMKRKRRMKKLEMHRIQPHWWFSPACKILFFYLLHLLSIAPRMIYSFFFLEGHTWQCSVLILLYTSGGLGGPCAKNPHRSCARQAPYYLSNPFCYIFQCIPNIFIFFEGNVPGIAQVLLPVCLGELYVVPGVKPRSVTCKTSSLTTILSLCTPNIFLLWHNS